MQPSEVNGPARIMIFIGVGVVLLGLTIFGVVFAKNRADTYANKGNDPVAQQENPPVQTTPNEEQTPAGSGSNDIAGAQTSTVPSNGVNVPAAGPQNTLVATVALASLAFFATKFVQSRRTRV